MPLEKQYVQVDFGSGLDESTASQLVMPGKLTSLVNGVISKTGQIGQRPGNTALSRNVLGASVLPTAKAMGIYGDALIYSSDRDLYSYAAADTWLHQDNLSEPVVTRQAVAESTASFRNPDVGYANGYTVFAWLGELTSTVTFNGRVFVTVVEKASGTVVFAQYPLTSATNYYNPRIVVIGSTVVVIYSDDSSRIWARSLDTASPTAWGTETQLVSDLNAATFKFEVSQMSDRFLVAYENTTPLIQLRTFNTSYTQQAAATIADGPGIYCWGSRLDSSDGVLWLAYGYTSGGSFLVRATRVNTTTLATSTSPTTVLSSAATNWIAIQIGVEKVDTDSAAIAWTILGTATTYMSYCRVITSAASVGTSRQLPGKFILESRPFVYSGHTYALFRYWSQLQGTYFLVDLNTHDSTLSTMRPVATISPRITTNNSSTVHAFSLSSVVSPATSMFTTCGAVVMSADVTGRSSITELDFDFTQTVRRQFAELGPNLHITGGVPSYYDSQQVGEVGFLLYPESDVVAVTHAGVGGATISGAGGGSSGVYSYCAVYKWVDAKGQTHRSAPSTAQTVTHAGGTQNTVDLVWSNYGLTTRMDAGTEFIPQVSLEIYRTEEDGAIFYQLTPDDAGAAASSLACNPTGTATIAYTDIRSDASIDGAGTALNTRPILYTTGGVVDNVCPPSASLVTIYKGRLILAGTDDPKAIWFSKKSVSGEPISFSDDFVTSIDDGGAITAIAGMDDKLVIFKHDRIYVMFGDGPSDTGANNDFSEPQRISVDTGCIEPRSVVLTPDGLMFQSSIGIYLISRGLEVSWVGADIEDTLASNVTITSAVLHPIQPWAMFSANGGGSTGVTLVYDYQRKQWSTFQFYDGVSTLSSCIVQSAVPLNDRYYWTTPGGAPHVDSPTVYSDDATFVELSLETAWLKMGGVQGFQRVRRVTVLGDYYTPHNLILSVAHNYVSSYTQATTFASSALSTSVEQFGAYIVQQKCESLRIKLRTTNPTPTSFGTGRGLTVNSLALEVGVKKGIFKLPITQGG